MSMFAQIIGNICFRKHQNVTLTLGRWTNQKLFLHNNSPYNSGPPTRGNIRAAACHHNQWTLGLFLHVRGFVKSLNNKLSLKSKTMNSVWADESMYFTWSRFVLQDALLWHCIRGRESSERRGLLLPLLGPLPLVLPLLFLQQGQLSWAQLVTLATRWWSRSWTFCSFGLRHQFTQIVLCYLTFCHCTLNLQMSWETNY